MGEVLCLIPARSGSKSVVHKNIRSVHGKPLIAYSIEQALASAAVTRTIVSTDSPLYASIAEQLGAEVPFMRPSELAGDLSTDLEVFQHALSWLEDNEGYVPEICVHLRPTHPVRRVEDIDEVVEVLRSRSDLDSVRSVVRASLTPFKMWFRDEEGFLKPAMVTHLQEAHNLPRQMLPEIFEQNGSIDVVRTEVITGLGSMTGKRIHGYVMQENFDIDTQEEFDRAAIRLVSSVAQTEGEPTGIAPTVCVDIDGVLASLVPSGDYKLAQPLRQNIELFNSLHDHGFRIVLFTARGSATGLDWSGTTQAQLKEWGVKFDELLFGKPAADFYIDDRMLTLDQARLLIDSKDDLSNGGGNND